MSGEFNTKLLLLLGENTCRQTGTKTKGTWGRKHLVPNNSFTTCPLREMGAHGTAQQLLPAFNMSHGLHRTGGGTTNQTDAGELMFGTVTIDLDPVYVPLTGMLENMTGANGTANRINWKVIGVRSIGEGDTQQEEHHYCTITGTNGLILNVAHHMGAEGDFLSLTLSAEVWQWKHYNSTGGIIRISNAAHFDLDGSEINNGMIA